MLEPVFYVIKHLSWLFDMTRHVMVVCQVGGFKHFMKEKYIHMLNKLLLVTGNDLFVREARGKWTSV